jgi:hypothetical protein
MDTPLDTKKMTTKSLSQRIAELEEIEAIRKLNVRLCQLVDAPYDREPVLNLWTEDGDLVQMSKFVGTGLFYGREQWGALMDDFAISYTFHWAANGVIELEPTLERARGHWHGWEAPIVSGEPVIGAFSHAHDYVKIDGEWLYESWRQDGHFFCSAKTGWEEGVRMRPARKSRGA